MVTNKCDENVTFFLQASLARASENMALVLFKNAFSRPAKRSSPLQLIMMNLEHKLHALIKMKKGDSIY